MTMARSRSTSSASVTLPNEWRPRHYQMPLWRYLENGGKRAIAIWHRRAGKDDLCLHWTAVSAMMKPGTYWHMLPEYAQARKAIWTAINPHTGKRRIDEAFPQAIRATTNEAEMFIRFKNGATWQVVGSDRYNTLVGSGVAGLVFSEWALAKPEAWGYLEPMVNESGGWALFITTPRGRNHAVSMYESALAKPGWHSELLTPRETLAFTEDQLETARQSSIELYGEDAGNAIFDQEYWCSFDVAVEGGLIPGYLFREAIGAAAKLGIEASGERVAGYDVADEGADKNAVVIRHGVEVIHAHHWAGTDTTTNTKQAAERAGRFNVDRLVYDSVGVGAGAKAAFKHMSVAFAVEGHNGGESPSAGLYVDGKRNADMFANRKAEAWWHLRDRFEETAKALRGEAFDADKIISISANLPWLSELQAELTQVTYSRNNAGKVAINKKPNNARSPNLADALVMAFRPKSKGPRLRGVF